MVNQKPARFEQFKTFSVLDRNFSPASGETTPPEKLKRRAIAERCAEVINAVHDRT